MRSIWSETCSGGNLYPSLKGEVRADAAIIGGGMAGILTAHQLKQAGLKTVVLEAERIGGGQTKNTTAKITSQHGLFYHNLASKKGRDTARLYLMANQRAVEEYARIVEKEGIDCDFERTDAYVYGQEEEILRQEAETAKMLGAPASYVSQIEIPVPNKGAVRFADQACFHPTKFVKGLASRLDIYENTPVKEAEGRILRTPSGQVQADHIVFATHFPFINFPGLYFMRMHQERSYVLALEGAESLHGMYIGDGALTYSLRQYGKYVLLGGEGHWTGKNQAGGRYETLRQAAQRCFPESREAVCWSAQDCMSADRIPYIGHYSVKTPQWYVATGFGKWGMSSSMVSAMLLRDLFCGAENPCSDVFSPSRSPVGEIPGILKDAGHTAEGLARRLSGKPPVCPHLGCRLERNPDEDTWECPCHGSRFDCHGKLLEGPAQEGFCHE